MGTLEHSWFQAAAPRNVYSATATSGTYQAAVGDLTKLHVLVSAGPITVERGNGSSVTATSKTIWPAYTPLFFRPMRDYDALGWAGSSTTVTVGIVQLG